MFKKHFRSHHTRASILIAFAFPLLLAACVRHSVTIRHEEPYTPPPVPDNRPVTVSGEVIAFPVGAEIPTLLASPALREGDLAALETAPGARMLLRPRMKVDNNTTGRFKLTIENRPEQISLELMPRIQSGSQVALGARIETGNPGGVIDSISQERLFQANSGDYSVYGPLKMDGHTAYALLRVDLP